MPILLLTRPLAQSREFLDDLSQQAGRRFRAVISPLAEHWPTGAALPPGTLVFTSGRAVEAVLASGARLAGRRAYAVGDRTAALATAAGAACRSASGAFDDLLALLLREEPQRFVHLRGEHIVADLAAGLRAAGRDAEEVIVYRSRDLPLSAAALRLLAGAEPVLAPVFSPRSAALLARYRVSAPLTVVAISAAAAEPFADRCPVAIAARPDAEAMRAAILQQWGNLS